MSQEVALYVLVSILILIKTYFIGREFVAFVILRSFTQPVVQSRRNSIQRRDSTGKIEGLDSVAIAAIPTRLFSAALLEQISRPADSVTFEAHARDELKSEAAIEVANHTRHLEAGREEISAVKPTGHAAIRLPQEALTILVEGAPSGSAAAEARSGEEPAPAAAPTPPPPLTHEAHAHVAIDIRRPLTACAADSEIAVQESSEEGSSVAESSEGAGLLKRGTCQSLCAPLAGGSNCSDAARRQAEPMAGDSSGDLGIARSKVDGTGELRPVESGGADTAAAAAAGSSRLGKRDAAQQAPVVPRASGAGADWGRLGARAHHACKEDSPQSRGELRGHQSPCTSVGDVPCGADEPVPSSHESAQPQCSLRPSGMGCIGPFGLLLPSAAAPAWRRAAGANSATDRSSTAAAGSDCPICLTGFEEGEAVKILPACWHLFHAPCIDTWLRTSATCPLCRVDLTAPMADEEPGPPRGWAHRVAEFI